MTKSATRRFRVTGVGTQAAVVFIATVSALASNAQAQSFRSALLGQPMVITVEGEAATAETVRLLHGLAKIESDVRLGMLFAHDHVKDPSGSHLSDPHEEIWPEIKDGLLAAGATDFDPAWVADAVAKHETLVDGGV